MQKKFYITTAIPYVNAKPHIGHVLGFAQTDVVARYHGLIGEEVVKLCGGDENALKNVQAAEKVGRAVQEFVDENNALFVSLVDKLNAKYDVWQKGSDQKQHFVSSQELWKRCDANGDIYKKKYKGLYCVGCETFYEWEELDGNGECFEHPGKKLDEVEEENYFFKLSNYNLQITNLIENDELKIVPEERKNEVLAFLKQGLQDLSISRSNERAKNWGVPVPGDNTQRVYVWFDALNIYQSGIGFGWDEEKYNKWWPADLHVIGKGIIRFHAVYWPAFLLSAKLALPKKILVHGYYTVNGQKMSKTLGNVYDPIPLLEKYGADPLRYYCLAKTPTFTDGDFSEEKFVEAYNADLANGLGNLVARIAKLCERASTQYSVLPFDELRAGSAQFTDDDFEEIRNRLGEFRFDEALRIIWGWIAEADQKIEQDKPWKLEGAILEEKLKDYVERIRKIAVALQPFLSETAEKIIAQFKGPKIAVAPPLFPRIN